MLILRAQFHYFKPAGACINVPVRQYYNFFHFPTPIEMEIDGQRIITKPNACIFSKPMAPRGFYFTQDTTMNWIHAYPAIEPLLEKYEIPLNTVFYPRYTGFISDLFRKMKMEILQEGTHYNDILDGYAVQFLVELTRSIHRDAMPQISSTDLNKFDILRFQMLSHPNEQWTVEKMAKSVSLSPSRLHAVYKALFGTSPKQDVISAKMDVAKTILLMEENLTLSEIAEQLGYKSTQHFILQFKETIGMTPGAYRKNNH